MQDVTVLPVHPAVDTPTAAPEQASKPVCAVSSMYHLLKMSCLDIKGRSGGCEADTYLWVVGGSDPNSAEHFGCEEAALI